MRAGAVLDVSLFVNCVKVSPSRFRISLLKPFSGCGVISQLAQVNGQYKHIKTNCAECAGIGRVCQNKCAECKGMRVKQNKKIIEVYIDPGMVEGQVITFHGQADQG